MNKYCVLHPEHIRFINKNFLNINIKRFITVFSDMTLIQTVNLLETECI